MAARHAVPPVVLQLVQGISYEIGQEASFQRNRLKAHERETGSDGGEKDVADEGEIVAKEQDKDGLVKVLFLSPEIEHCNENDGNEIVAYIKEGHEIRQPGHDPAFGPYRGMNPEEKQVDPDQAGVNILPQVLDQVSQGFVNENDKEDGRKVVEERPEMSCPSLSRDQLESKEQTDPDRVPKQKGTPEGNLVSKQEDQEKQSR